MFHPLEIVSRYCDPQLQVGKKINVSVQNTIHVILVLYMQFYKCESKSLTSLI